MWSFHIKNLCRLISFGLIFFFVFLKIHVCQDYADPFMPPTPEAPCHILAGFYVTRVMDMINECTSKSDTGEVDRKRVRQNPLMPHINCVLKCVAMKVGLLNSDGQIDASNTAFFVEERLPAQYQEFAFTVLSECFIKAIDLNHTDPNCASYKNLFQCIPRAAKRLNKLCYAKTPSTKTSSRLE